MILQEREGLPLNKGFCVGIFLFFFFLLLGCWRCWRVLCADELEQSGRNKMVE